MAYGYWNKVLRVDLSKGEIREQEVDDQVWKTCVGGAGFGAKVLLEETTAATGPYDPENPVVFALGPYQTGISPGSAKWSVVSKSPITKTYADSAGGADWGVRLKGAGYDALVITGAADSPVYLRINEDDVEIKDGSQLWSLDSYETRDAVREREGDDYSVVTIGPAGEKRVALACVVADAHSFAGRGGIGAVMGSKNLKAIAVRGFKKPEVYDEEMLMKRGGELTRKVYEENGLREHGTPDLCEFAESVGDMPIKYWTADTWSEGAKKLGGETYTETLNAKPLSCANCPIGCHRDIEVKEGPYAIAGPGPEYETLGMLGTNLFIDDLEAVARANEMCNRLGIDTISTGACIGLAMECYERGWLTEDDTGLDLTWGSTEATLELVEQIGNREGFGAIFAEGSLPAARQIHPAAENLVVHVKGLDYPSHDPRVCTSLALTYATGTRGACHFRGPTEDTELGGFYVPEIDIGERHAEYFTMEHKADLVAKMQDYSAWINSAVLCMFVPDEGDLSLSEALELFNAATGWDWTPEDLKQAGARIHTLQRLVNVRDGHGRHTDTLPYKMTVAAEEGFRTGKIPSGFEDALEEYYEIRGWERKTGVPTGKTLEDLGLYDYGEKAGIV